MKRYLVASLAVGLWFASSTAAQGKADDYWPSWRGPLATGEAPKAKPPTEWSETKNVRWKVAIPGRGHATPAVWGDRVYVLSAVKTDKKTAMAVPPPYDAEYYAANHAQIRQTAMPAASETATDASPPRSDASALGGRQRPLVLDPYAGVRAKLQYRFGGDPGSECMTPFEFRTVPADVDTNQPSVGAYSRFLQEKTNQHGHYWNGDITHPTAVPALYRGDRPFQTTLALYQDRPRGERPPGGGGGRRNEKPDTVYDFVVMCLDRNTGKTIWQKTVHSQIPHSGTHPDATQASASPIVDGEHIYASFGSFGIYCLDLQGNVKWNIDLGDQQTRNSFGEGSSPALHGDTLIVNWDHEEKDFIVALDKKTGKEVWRKERDEPTNWTTPLIVEVAGKAQVIVPGTSKCISYDLKTGDTVWTCGGLTQNVIPSPVYHDGVVYLMSGFRGSALKAIKLADAKGDLSEKKDAIVFESSEHKTPYVPSSLLYQGCLYFFDNNKAVLTNLDAKTGKENFARERIDGMQQVYASPIGANGFVYLCGRDGETVVIKAGPKLEIVTTNKLEDGFDASPVAVGDQLFLRGREHLYCIAP